MVPKQTVVSAAGMAKIKVLEIAGKLECSSNRRALKGFASEFGSENSEHGVYAKAATFMRERAQTISNGFFGRFRAKAISECNRTANHLLPPTVSTNSARQAHVAGEIPKTGTNQKLLDELNKR